MKIAVRALHRRGHGPWETWFVLALLASAAAPVAAPATPGRIDSDANQIRSESKSNAPSKFWDGSHVTYPPDEEYMKTLQDRVPSSTPHPCEANSDSLEMRSKTRPTSVHRLRPGDIDVISAMGDSLVTANGARETNAMGIFIDDRGVSFLGGGQGTWHEFTTLPNIIKVFNPNLRGYAYGRGLLSSGEGALNVAGPGTRTADLLFMSKLFVQRMKKDNNYDFENDWKMLNILTGHNNVCTFECYEKERHSPEAHKRDLQEALDYLYENVPRLYVNILPVIDATINPRTTSGIICSIIRRLGCRCMYTESSYEEGVHKLSTTVRKYQAAEMELVFGGRYDGREDFTVEWQPFLRSLNAPERIGDPEDPVLLQLLQREERIWTMDCFHFNQRGHMTMAIQLWNNMMEPVGNKSETFSRFLNNQYRCPTKEHPYLFTKKNSETFMKEGHQ